MAALKYTLNVTVGDGTNPFIAGNDYRGNCTRLSHYFKRVASGSRNTTNTIDVRNSAVQATGTITIASGTGSIAAVINGVTVSVTWATSDTATAAALAAAINASASALILNMVTATSALGVVTLTAVPGGVFGNAVTLAATGTGATASGARLTGGTETVISMVL